MLEDFEVVHKELLFFQVSVRISSLFANKTCGLCGNYNGESFDDFVTPEGKLVNDVTKPTLFFSQVQNSAAKIFASSWIATDRKCTKGVYIILIGNHSDDGCSDN